MVRTWVTIKDNDSVTPMFGGEDIYCYCDEFEFNNEAILNPRPKTFAVTEILVGSDNYLVKNNYNRRKPFVSYVGFNIPSITMSGLWQVDGIGSEQDINGATRKILSPYKIMRMVNSPKQDWFMKDEYIIPSMITGEEEQVYAFNETTKVFVQDGVRTQQFYDSKGMPFHVESFSLKASADNPDDIRWTLSLKERRDE